MTVIYQCHTIVISFVYTVMRSVHRKKYSPMTVVNKERNNKTQLDKANKALTYYTKAHAQQPVHQQYFFANRLHNVLSENCNFLKKLCFLLYIGPENVYTSKCTIVTCT